MAAEVVDDGSGHPLRRGLITVRAGVDDLLDGSTWSVTDGELGDLVVDVTTQIGRLEAAKARLVREHVSRETPDARGQRGARTVNLLRSRCRALPGRAAADVANAKATCPDTGDLRALGTAWEAGQTTREHVDVARRCLAHLPRKVVRERRAEVDQVLTAHARVWDPGTATRLADHLLSTLVPDRLDRYDEHAYERRHLAVTTDSTGMVLVRGQLDPAAGLGFVATLHHLVEQDRAAGGTGEGVGGVAGDDVRTRGERQADALARMSTLAAENAGLAPTPERAPTDAGEPTERPQPAAPAEVAEAAEGGEPSEPGECSEQALDGGRVPRQRAVRSVPRVVVITTPEQLSGAADAGASVTTDGTLVEHGTLVRLTCDAIVDRVVLAPDGRILATDTIGRLATAAQQHALAARDRGCAWPGCTTPPNLCEAHHVVWWSRGGPTTIDNLALLCHRHHTQIHSQLEEPGAGWHMLVRDGLPWFRPPDRLDPTGALRRNTFHDAADAARRTGTRWRRLAYDGPVPPQELPP
jgi:hypothetical protein